MSAIDESIKKKLFIEIEAPEFAGKTTLINRIKKMLINDLDSWGFIRLPGFTKFGEDCRNILKYTEATDKAILGLAFASHMDIYSKLANNINYISDRGFNSFIVYQAYLKNLNETDPVLFEVLKNEIKSEIDSYFNRYTIYLDIPAEEIIRRREITTRIPETGKNDLDRYDSLDLANMQKLVDSYRKVLIDEHINPKNKTFTLDATLRADKLADKAFTVINEILEREN